MWCKMTMVHSVSADKIKRKRTTYYVLIRVETAAR